MGRTSVQHITSRSWRTSGVGTEGSTPVHVNHATTPVTKSRTLGTQYTIMQNTLLGQCILFTALLQNVGTQAHDGHNIASMVSNTAMPVRGVLLVQDALLGLPEHAHGGAVL